MNASSRRNEIAARFAARDLRAMIAIADARKREDDAARASCRANKELETFLREAAARRGEVFSWDVYFRNIGL